jgi:hypothetical protein
MRIIFLMKFRTLLAFAVLLVGAGLLVVYLLNDDIRRWPHDPFRAEVWRATPPNERYKQVRDLLDRSILAGITEGQVEELLGQPTYKSPDSAYFLYMVRERGAGEPGFEATKLLQVDFANHKVVKAWLRSD